METNQRTADASGIKQITTTTMPTTKAGVIESRLDRSRQALGEDENENLDKEFPINLDATLTAKIFPWRTCPRIAVFSGSAVCVNDKPTGVHTSCSNTPASAFPFGYTRTCSSTLGCRLSWDQCNLSAISKKYNLRVPMHHASCCANKTYSNQTAGMNLTMFYHT